MKVKDVQHGKTTRKSFARINEILEMPNLIEVQKKSYQWFLDEGLREVFADTASITDYTGNLELSFLDYSMDEEPKYSVEECKARDATYASPLKVRMRLRNKETGEIKEQEIFMGDFPKMTDSATFIINGAERAIVSQLVRSPGVYYGKEYDKTDKMILSATVIPYRGAWLEYETDANDVFYVRIDKNRKIPITSFIRAIGVKTDAEIKELFGEDPLILATLDKDPAHTSDEALIEIYKKMRPGEPPSVESATSLMDAMFFDMRRYDISAVGRYKYNKKLDIARRITGHKLLSTAVDPMTGEVLAEENEVLGRDKARLLSRRGVNHVTIESGEGTAVKVFGNGMVDIDDFSDYTGFSAEELGVKEKVRFSVLKEIIDSGVSGEEMKKTITTRMHDLIPKTIIVDDMLASICYLLGLGHGIGTTDDIDHLGNRRLRCVGELLQNQFRIGLSRMERVVRERMTTQDQDKMTAQALVNIRPVVAAIKEFFGSSQLSQFMDQTNPLAELTHKRRLSALGPGGLSRERAGFEVRDVHYSHYGRMCPVETPEGPNIGLISSLSNYGIVNKYGLIETPYRRINPKTHEVTNECLYVTADIEENKVIAQASEPLSDTGAFLNRYVACRRGPDVLEASPEEVDLMDVSPKQVVSIGTSLIPFLEHDDTNRALMGANMQRQAVPLLRPEAPLVGTGMEWVAGQDSGVCVLAKRSGVVTSVNGKQIIVRADNGEYDTYDLIKFLRSNQSTCINQHPIVYKGDKVEAGQTLADGMSTDGGELALGHNVLVAFVSWEGYNHEDAVLISERLCKDDLYTSIHIEEYECDARDTKLGEEEITRELASVSDDALKNLDENGIIRIGADVRPGDILVGKVTPKGETELTPEERLLRAIFGDKEREVRDTSLRVPHGEFGKVVDVKEFTRENGDELAPGVNKLVRVYVAQKRKLREGDKMAGRHGNKCVCSRILPVEDMPFTPDGRPVDLVLNPLGVPSRMNIGQILEIHLSWACHMLGEEIKEAKTDPVKAKALEKRLREAGYDFDTYGMPESTESGVHIATPVFDGCRDEDLAATLAAAGLPVNAKSDLYDGRTGEKLDGQVTIGWKYMLKLHHLVDDKIHARSTGPYSLVTQQPLGGKAQFGGQRFGEMEVWALEAYGAAYTLQEILTVKSDDVIGRVKAYEKIVKGENIPSPGVPESFKVLMKELQSIGLDVRVLNEDKEEVVMKELDESDLEPSNGGERWHKDEVKAAMEGEDSVSAARNAMESSMAGEGKEVPADDTASFNDTLEAEAAAPANEEAAFTETDIETEAGLVDDPDA